MARKTKEDSQKNRDSILDAALVVISKKGMSYVTMADIADQAKVSRGAVYGHYKNKVEVALAMVKRSFDAVIRPEKSLDESCLEYAYRLGLYHLHLAVEPSQLQQILFVLYTKVDEEEPLKEVRREWETSYFNEVQQSLEDAVKGGELPSALNLEFATTYLQALFDGIFSLIYFYKEGDQSQWPVAEQLYLVGFETIKSSPRFLKS